MGGGPPPPPPPPDSGGAPPPPPPPEAAAAPVPEKVWERAWTIKELRAGTKDWTLAADCGLLLYLQDFSQRVLSRTHELEKAVDGLVHETKVSLPG